MIEWVYDDGGRSAAGYKGDAGDCVARAVAIATARPYSSVYNELALLNQAQRRGKRMRGIVGKRSARSGIYTKTASFKRYMLQQGFSWTPCMTIGSGCKVHLRDDELPLGYLVVMLSRHAAAVIDGILHDTYDCSRSGTRCVYGYWKLER